MDDKRNADQAEAERQGDTRQQQAADRYQRAQSSGSVERERAALHALDVQTLENRLARLEGKVNRLEDEDEVAALRGERQQKSV